MKPKGYWTEERCLEAAKACSTTSEFKSKFLSAYSASHKHGWYDSYTWLDRRITKPAFYWTKTRCHKEAMGCSSKTEFRKKNLTAHDYAYRNGWLDEWFTSESKPKGYWTLDKCIEVAKTCASFNEFRKKYPGAHTAIRMHGWNINDYLSEEK